MIIQNRKLSFYNTYINNKTKNNINNKIKIYHKIIFRKKNVQFNFNNKMNFRMNYKFKKIILQEKQMKIV